MNNFRNMFQGFGMGDAKNPGIMQSLTGQTAPQWLGLAPQGQNNVYSDANSPMPQPAGMLSQTQTPKTTDQSNSNPFEGTGINPLAFGLLASQLQGAGLGAGLPFLGGILGGVLGNEKENTANLPVMQPNNFQQIQRQNSFLNYI